MAKPLKKKKRRIVPRTMLVFGIAAILCTLYYMAVSLLLEKDWIPFPTKWWALSADIVVIVFTILAVIVLLMTCCAIVAGLRKIQAHNDSLQTDLRRLVTSQTQSEAILTQISENVLLSDSIKSVAFREKDRNVLTDAIYQDMRMERWNSALALTQELARCFGGR